jgi:lipoprotein-releasing system permease protein
MLTNLEYFIAWRYLKAKKQESFISVVAMFSFIGTALGVAALIAVMAVMAGVREEWTSKLIGSLGAVNIYSSSSSVDIDDYNSLITRVQKLPDVSHASAVIEKQVMVSANKNNFGVQIRALSPSDLQAKNLISSKIKFGSIKSMMGNQIIIGQSLANSLDVFVGDEVKIISPQSNSTLIGTIPRFKTCRIAAIFDSGMSDLDSSVIFINLDLAQLYFNMPKKVNLIEISTTDQNDVELIRNKIQQKIGNHYKVVDWKQRNSSFMSALQTERVAMFVILTLIMIVAAFNIISSLIMLVKDKTSDIAILRTMGTEKSTIIKIFFICGSFIGVLGTIIGTILGIAFASNIDLIRIFLQNITGATLFDPLIYFLAFLPAKIYVSDVLIITSMSLLLSFLATIYPAYRAAKLNPATALKFV